MAGVAYANTGPCRCTCSNPLTSSHPQKKTHQPETAATARSKDSARFVRTSLQLLPSTRDLLSFLEKPHHEPGAPSRRALNPQVSEETAANKNIADAPSPQKAVSRFTPPPSPHPRPTPNTREPYVDPQRNPTPRSSQESETPRPLNP